jgi:hypothetical protein
MKVLGKLTAPLPEIVSDVRGALQWANRPVQVANNTRGWPLIRAHTE